ncbi:MAG: HD domain-containing protein [Bacillota bacterium]
MSFTPRLLALRLLPFRFIPAYVRDVMGELERQGHSAYAVGGGVRDLVLGRTPADWDLATSALPEQIRRLFPRSVPTGIKHGTVTVLSLRPVQVTTYRVERGYSDHRRPDQVRFVDDVAEDLKRRDFTINSLALDRRGRLIDVVGGLTDLRLKVVRAVGDAAERFHEDALRMLRAVRFAAQLGMELDAATWAAIPPLAHLLGNISAERIRDELTNMLLTARPAWAMERLRESGLLAQFLPELLEGVGMEQNVHHAYNVWEHSLVALDAVPAVLRLRLAALLHDVAKPRCLSVSADGARHFFDHEHVGAGLARRILKRLKFDNQTVDGVSHLIKHHMALHYQRQMKDPAIRRLIKRVGLEHMDDLLRLREADRKASGKKPGPISKGTARLLRRIEQVLAQDAAFGLKDLAIDGHDVMTLTGLPPGPEVGRLLRELLEEVLEDPSLNTKPALEALVRAKVGP